MTHGLVYMLTETGRRTLKVGFTTNMDLRKKSYHTHNSGVLFIDVIEGTDEDEKQFHKELERMGFDRVFPLEKTSEWFKIPKGIKKAEIIHAGFELFTK